MGLVRNCNVDIVLANCNACVDGLTINRFCYTSVFFNKQANVLLMFYRVFKKQKALTNFT